MNKKLTQFSLVSVGVVISLKYFLTLLIGFGLIVLLPFIDKFLIYIPIVKSSWMFFLQICAMIINIGHML